MIVPLYKTSFKLEALSNPAKVFLHNPNLCSVIAKGRENLGTLRETFLFSMFYRTHEVTLPLNGDFLIDRTILLEVGGARKSNQHQKAYVAADDLEIGIGNKIPLWLFGFLY